MAPIQPVSRKPTSDQVHDLLCNYDGPTVRSNLLILFKSLKDKTKFVLDYSLELATLSRNHGLPYAICNFLILTLTESITISVVTKQTVFRCTNALQHSLKEITKHPENEQRTFLERSYHDVEDILKNQALQNANFPLSSLALGYAGILRFLRLRSKGSSTLTKNEVESMQISHQAKLSLLKALSFGNDTSLIYEPSINVGPKLHISHPSSMMYFFEQEEQEQIVAEQFESLSEIDFKDLLSYTNSEASIVDGNVSQLAETPEDDTTVIERLRQLALAPVHYVEILMQEVNRTMLTKANFLFIVNYLDGALLEQSRLMKYLSIRNELITGCFEILQRASQKQILPEEVINFFIKWLSFPQENVREYVTKGSITALEILLDYSNRGLIDWSDDRKESVKKFTFRDPKLHSLTTKLLFEISPSSPDLFGKILKCLSTNEASPFKNVRIEHGFLIMIQTNASALTDVNITMLFRCVQNTSFDDKVREICAKAILEHVEGKVLPVPEGILKSLYPLIDEESNALLKELIKLICLSLLDGKTLQEKSNFSKLCKLIQSVKEHEFIFVGKLLMFLCKFGASIPILILSPLIPFLTGDQVLLTKQHKESVNCRSLSYLVATVVSKSYKAYDDCSLENRLDWILSSEDLDIILEFVGSSSNENLLSKILLAQSIGYMFDARWDGVTLTKLESCINSPFPEVRVPCSKSFARILLTLEELDESQFSVLPAISDSSNGCSSTDELLLQIINKHIRKENFELNEGHFHLVEKALLLETNPSLQNLALEVLSCYLNRNDAPILHCSLVSTVEILVGSDDFQVSKLASDVMLKIVELGETVSERFINDVCNLLYYPDLSLWARNILGKISAVQDLSDDAFEILQMEKAALYLLKDEERLPEEFVKPSQFLMNKISLGCRVSQNFFEILKLFIPTKPKLLKIAISLLVKVACNSQSVPSEVIQLIGKFLHSDSTTEILQIILELYITLVQNGVEIGVNETTKMNNLLEIIDNLEYEIVERLIEWEFANVSYKRNAMSDKVFFFVLNYYAKQRNPSLLQGILTNVRIAQESGHEYNSVILTRLQELLNCEQMECNLAQDYIFALETIVMKNGITGLNKQTVNELLSLLEKEATQDSPRVIAILQKCNLSQDQLHNLRILEILLCQNPSTLIHTLNNVAILTVKIVPPVWNHILLIFEACEIKNKLKIMDKLTKLIKPGCGITETFLNSVLNSILKVAPNKWENFVLTCLTNNICIPLETVKLIERDFIENDPLFTRIIPAMQKVQDLPWTLLNYKLETKQELQTIFNTITHKAWFGKITKSQISTLLLKSESFQVEVAKIFAVGLVRNICSPSEHIGLAIEAGIIALTEKDNIPSVLIFAYKILLQGGYCSKVESVLNKMAQLIRSGSCSTHIIIDVLECFSEAVVKQYQLPVTCRHILNDCIYQGNVCVQFTLLETLGCLRVTEFDFMCEQILRNINNSKNNAVNCFWNFVVPCISNECIPPSVAKIKEVFHTFATSLSPNYATELNNVWDEVQIKHPEHTGRLFILLSYTDSKYQLGYDCIWLICKTLSLFPTLITQVLKILEYCGNKAYIYERISSHFWCKAIPRITGTTEESKSNGQDRLAFDLQHQISLSHMFDFYAVLDSWEIRSTVPQISKMLELMQNNKCRLGHYMSDLKRSLNSTEFIQRIQVRNILTAISGDFDLFHLEIAICGILAANYDYNSVHNFVRDINPTTQKQVNSFTHVLEIILLYKPVDLNFTKCGNKLKSVQIKTWEREMTQMIISQQPCIQVKSGEQMLQEILHNPTELQTRMLNGFANRKTAQKFYSQIVQSILSSCTDSKIKPHFGHVNVWSNDQIKEWAVDFRIWVQAGNNDPNKMTKEVLVEFLNVALRAKFLCSQIKLNEHQIVSILCFWLNYKSDSTSGSTFQIPTGAGKTTILSVISVLLVLVEGFVDVYTSNPVLAERDAKQNKKFYEMFGITCGCNIDKVRYTKGAKLCYFANKKPVEIVYGTLAQFSFDYLRNDYHNLQTLGERTPMFALMDEADNLLVDEILNTSKLASDIPGFDCFIPCYMLLSEQLKFIKSHLFKYRGTHYKIKGVLETRDDGKKVLVRNYTIIIEDWRTFLENEPPENVIAQGELIDNLSDWIQNHLTCYLRCVLFQEKFDQFSNPHEEEIVQIPLHLKNFVDLQIPKWVSNCIASQNLKQFKDYVISNDEIKPVDFSSTGIIHTGTQWCDGLHQYVQILNGVKVTTENLNTNFLSTKACLAKYSSNKIFGFTGTIGSSMSQSFMAQAYNMNAYEIPDPYNKRFIQFETKILHTRDDWAKEIAKAIALQYHCGRASLVICESIESADFLRVELEHCQEFGGRIIQYTMNEMNQEHRVSKIAEGDAIIATNLAGRGTDINAHDIEENGGLQVILTYEPKNSRVKEQAFGRTARQGRAGTGISILLGSGSAAQCENTVLDNIANNLLPLNNTKDAIFREYCAELRNIRTEISHRYNKHQTLEIPILLSTIETEWGLFIHQLDKNNASEIVAKTKFAEFLGTLRQYIATPETIPNIFHHIQVGNKYLYAGGRLWNFNERVIHIFSNAIRTTNSHSSSAPAYLGLATIAIENRDINSSFYGFQDTDNYQTLAYKYLRRALHLFCHENKALFACSEINSSPINSALSNQQRVKIQLYSQFFDRVTQAEGTIKKSLRLFNITASNISNEQRIFGIYKGQHSKDLKKLKKFSQFNLELNNLTYFEDLGRSTDQALLTLMNSKVYRFGLKFENIEHYSVKELVLGTKYFRDLLKNEANEVLAKINIGTAKVNLIVRAGNETPWTNISVDEAIRKVSQETNATFDIEILPKKNVNRHLGNCKMLISSEFMEYSTLMTFLNNKPDSVIINSILVRGNPKCINEYEKEHEHLCIRRVEHAESEFFSESLLSLPIPTNREICIRLFPSSFNQLTRFVDTDCIFLVEICTSPGDKDCLNWIETSDLASRHKLTLTMNNITVNGGTEYIRYLRSSKIQFSLVLRCASFKKLETLIQCASLDQQDIYIRDKKQLSQLYFGSYIPKLELKELAYRGIYAVFEVYEGKNTPWVSIGILVVIGALKLYGGYKLLSIYPNVAVYLLTSGMADIALAIRTGITKEFEWNSYCKNQCKGAAFALLTIGIGNWLGMSPVASLGFKWELISAGVSLGANALGDWLADKGASQFRQRIANYVEQKFDEVFHNVKCRKYMSKIQAVDTVFNENGLAYIFNGLITDVSNGKHSVLGKLWQNIANPLIHGLLSQRSALNSKFNIIFRIVTLLVGSVELATAFARMERIIMTRFKRYYKRYKDVVWLVQKTCKCSWVKARGLVDNKEYKNDAKYKESVDQITNLSAGFEISKISIMIRQLTEVVTNILQQILEAEVIGPLTNWITSQAMHRITNKCFKMRDRRKEKAALKAKEVDIENKEEMLVDIKRVEGEANFEGNSAPNKQQKGTVEQKGDVDEGAVFQIKEQTPESIQTNASLVQEDIPKCKNVSKSSKSNPNNDQTDEMFVTKETVKKLPASKPMSNDGPTIKPTIKGKVKQNPGKGRAALATVSSVGVELSDNIPTTQNAILDNASNLLNLSPCSSYAIDNIKPMLNLYCKDSGESVISNYCIRANSTDPIPPQLTNAVTSLFSGSKRLLILVHGFRSNPDAWANSIKDEIFQQHNRDRIVAILDWSGGSGILNYPQAVENIPETARWLSEILLALCSNSGDNIKQIYGIGHSLGAHVVGKTASLCAKKGVKFSRITGLDPARPLVENEPFLNYTCANMVDIIHTDCHYGNFNPHGTLDFYPNYGHSQPSTSNQILSKIPLFTESHNRAHKLFLFSIKNPELFKTKKILVEGGVEDGEVLAQMGYYADGPDCYKGETGVASKQLFFLDTTEFVVPKTISSDYTSPLQMRLSFKK